MYYDKPEAFFATIVATATKAKTEPFVVVSAPVAVLNSRVLIMSLEIFH